MAIHRYLSRYAEPECERLAIQGVWDSSVVIPLCDESTNVDLLLGSLAKAAAAFSLQVLVIAVINSQEKHGPSVRAANAALLKKYNAQPCRPNLTLLIIDRTSPGLELPEKTGVGLARKIGCDLALTLLDKQCLRDPWIRTTDADVEVPIDYFRPHELPKTTSALVYPYEHIFDGGSPIDALALTLYEIRLRYYCLSLKRAGSPYAFQTLGSTLAFSAKAYAQVRGFPKREAGEDFYLLNKLSHVGTIAEIQSTPLRIHQRSSDRTPFGTGAAMQTIGQNINAGEIFTLYSPTTFDWLKLWMGAIHTFSNHRDPKKTREELYQRDERLGRALETLGVFLALAVAANTRTTPEQIRRHMHVWFDALKTLRFIHVLKTLGIEETKYREALASVIEVSDRDTEGDCLAHLRVTAF
jgi:hypothetical protein